MPMTDCPPGTVPSWVLWFAYDGEEWLVLADEKMSSDLHRVPCERRYWYEWNGKRFAIGRAEYFARASCGCDLYTAHDDAGQITYYDSRPEAEAAFTRIEQEWRAAKAGVL